MMIPEGGSICHAPRYAAAHCYRCDTSSRLRLRADGEFECSSPVECDSNLGSRLRSAIDRDDLEMILRYLKGLDRD
jgi:hypothetical protein